MEAKKQNEARMVDPMNQPKLSVRVSEAFRARVRQAAAARNMLLEPWLTEAIVAHLEAAGVTVDSGPLQGLDAEDRRRVLRFIRFLEKAPAGLKEASDLGQRVLDRALREITHKP